MNKNRSRKRSALLTVGILLIGLSLACLLWVKKEQRQYALNRQLIEALVESDTRKALFLVDEGADPNIRMKTTLAPSLTQLCQQILHHKPLPVAYSPTAFMFACGESLPVGSDFINIQEDLPLMQAMLRHGANVNAKSINGDTLLVIAFYGSRAHTVELLLEHGVKVNAQAPDGSTALMLASFPDHEEIFGFLLAHGAAVNVQDRWGRTALSIAVRSLADKGVIERLLAHGANPNHPDQDGVTPLMLAQKYHRPDLVALLRKYSKRP